MSAKRAAAIDIGTNTALLLIAEYDRGGLLHAVRDEATITRLGQGVDKTRRLAPEAVARTKACLDVYARIVKESGVGPRATRIVGTSAMRDAGGSDELHTFVRERFGVDVETIGGDEEAALTFEGALSGLAIDASDVVVFDIGGGSTEFVRGRGGTVEFAQSLDVGSVRITERHVRSDPPTASELAAARDDIRRLLTALPSLHTAQAPVGIAGTVTTVAAICRGVDPYDPEKIHGSTLTRVDVATVLDRLASVPLAERQQIAGLEPKRADVIVCGALLLLECLEKLGASCVTVSDRGVRWGVAARLLA
jgi:exopolyphosphatase/guanosine-5'-triphosphate,3'-diphosphate pyrophosphatase